MCLSFVDHKHFGMLPPTRDYVNPTFLSFDVVLKSLNGLGGLVSNEARGLLTNEVNVHLYSLVSLVEDSLGHKVLREPYMAILFLLE